MEICKGKDGVPATFASNIGDIDVLSAMYAHFHTPKEIARYGGFWEVLSSIYW